MSHLTSRPWPVTVGGFLLVAQGAALLGMGFALLEAATEAARTPLRLSVGLPVFGTLCLVLALVAIVNGLHFLRRRRGAWLMAMLLQGLSLALALLLYWRGHRMYSYPMMVVGILLVVQLNRGDVMGYLQTRSGGRSRERGSSGHAGGDADDY